MKPEPIDPRPTADITWIGGKPAWAGGDGQLERTLRRQMICFWLAMIAAPILGILGGMIHNRYR
jgi:hypothetical protein